MARKRLDKWYSSQMPTREEYYEQVEGHQTASDNGRVDSTNLPPNGISQNGNFRTTMASGEYGFRRDQGKESTW